MTFEVYFRYLILLLLLFCCCYCYFRC